MDLARPFAPTSWRYQYVPYPAYAAADPAGGAEVAAQVTARGVAFNTVDYAPPLFIADASSPVQKVGWWDSQVPSNKTSSEPGVALLLQRWAQVPIPAGFQPAGGTDMEAVIWQPSTDKVWEFWRLRRNNPAIYNPVNPGVTPYEDPSKNVYGDTWQATWGGRIDAASTNLTTAFKVDGDATANGAAYGHGVAASGLSLFGGTITARELQAGRIAKAIDIAVPVSARRTTTTEADGTSWPGYRTDGNLRLDQPSPYGGMVLRQGQRLVMDRNVSTAGMHPLAAMIVVGLQTYGCAIRDTAGSVAVVAQNASTWTQAGQPDPYDAILAGTPKYQIMRQIPWGKLRTLPKDYGKPA